MSIYRYKIRFELNHAIQGVIVIPIASLSVRLRSGSPTYMQVVVPDYDTYSEEINARATGTMSIYKKIIGVTGWEAIIEAVDLERIRIDIGALSKSITLSGHCTYTNLTPTTVTLQDYSYISVAEYTTIRCSLFNTPLPGDTVIAGAYANIVADQVVYTVNSRQANMEVRGI